ERRRREARKPARRGPHRAGHAQIPDRPQRQGLHRYVRGFARHEAAARHRHAALDGRWLRLRRRG
nr:hypothetical protein [Tanacetum cinerariifolium]